MVELLGSYTEDNASQARVDAHRYTDVLHLSFIRQCIDPQHTYTRVCLIFRCIVRALKDPNTFLMDHLLTLKPVRFLEGELIHDVSTKDLCIPFHSPYNRIFTFLIHQCEHLPEFRSNSEFTFCVMYCMCVIFYLFIFILKLGLGL